MRPIINEKTYEQALKLLDEGKKNSTVSDMCGICISYVSKLDRLRRAVKDKKHKEYAKHVWGSEEKFPETMVAAVKIYYNYECPMEYIPKQLAIDMSNIVQKNEAQKDYTDEMQTIGKLLINFGTMLEALTVVLTTMGEQSARNQEVMIENTNAIIQQIKENNNRLNNIEKQMKRGGR